MAATINRTYHSTKSVSIPTSISTAGGTAAAFALKPASALRAIVIPSNPPSALGPSHPNLLIDPSTSRVPSVLQPSHMIYPSFDGRYQSPSSAGVSRSDQLYAVGVGAAGAGAVEGRTTSSINTCQDASRQSPQHQSSNPQQSPHQIRTPRSHPGLNLPSIPEASTSSSSNISSAPVQTSQAFAAYHPTMDPSPSSFQAHDGFTNGRRASQTQVQISASSASAASAGSASRARSQTLPSIRDGRGAQPVTGPAGSTPASGPGAPASSSATGPATAKMSPKSPKAPALHTGGGKPPSQCRFCDMSFKKLEHCQRHERTHTLDRPYPCKVCGKAFARQDTLNRHARLHDRRDDAPPVGSTTSPNSFAEIALPGQHLEPSSGKARGRRRVKSVSDTVGPSPMVPRTGGSPHLSYPQHLAGPAMGLSEWAAPAAVVPNRRMSEGGMTGSMLSYSVDGRFGYDGTANALGLAGNVPHMNMPALAPGPPIGYDYDRLSPSNSDSTPPRSDHEGSDGLLGGANSLDLVGVPFNHLHFDAGRPDQPLNQPQLSFPPNEFSPRGTLLRDLHGLNITTPPSGNVMPLPLPSYGQALQHGGHVDPAVTFSPTAGQGSNLAFQSTTPLQQVQTLQGTPSRFAAPPPELDGYHESEHDLESSTTTDSASAAGFRLGSVGASSIGFSPSTTINELPTSSELGIGPVPGGAVGMTFSPPHGAVPTLPMATVPEDAVAPNSVMQLNMFDFLGRATSNPGALGLDVNNWREGMVSDPAAGVSPAQTISTLPPEEDLAELQRRSSFASLNFLPTDSGNRSPAHMSRAALHMPLHASDSPSSQPWSIRPQQPQMSQQQLSAGKGIRRQYVPSLSSRSMQNLGGGGNGPDHTRHLVMPTSAPPPQETLSPSFGTIGPEAFQLSHRSRSMSLDCSMNDLGGPPAQHQHLYSQPAQQQSGWFPSIPIPRSGSASNRSSSGLGLGLSFDAANAGPTMIPFERHDSDNSA